MKKLRLCLQIALAALFFAPAGLAAAPKNAPRERIAVAEPRAVSGVTESDINGLSEYLESKLGGSYEIFSRTALKALIKEFNLSNSGMMLDEGTRTQLALKSVNCLFVYTISKLGSRFSMTMMVVDSSTGEVRKGQRAAITALSLDELVGRIDAALDSMGLLAGSGAPKVKKLALLPVECADGVQSDIPAALHAKLSSYLLKSGVFELVSREDLEKIARESAMADGALTASGQYAKIGQLQLADCLAVVKIERYDHYAVGSGTAMAGCPAPSGRMTMQVTVRIVDLKTGKIISSESLRDSIRSTDIPAASRREWLAADYENAFVEHASAKVGEYILDRLDPLLVAAVEDSTVYLTRGSGAGVYAGQYYHVYNTGRPVVHPRTGQVLGTTESFAGTIQVVQITPGLSIAAVCDKPAAPIRPGAFCRLAEPSSIGGKYGVAPEPPPPPPAYPMAN